MNGLRTKLNELRLLLATCTYNIVMLTETNLTPDFHDGELGFVNYNLFRCDRSPESSDKSSGGGVLVAVDKDLSSRQIITPVYDTFETLFLSVMLNGNMKLLLNCVYIPPGKPLSVYNNYCLAVEDVMSTESVNSMESALIGDFNLPHINWHLEDSAGLTASARAIKDLAGMFGLLQNNHVLNSRGVLLDLVFASAESHVRNESSPLIPIDVQHPALNIVLRTGSVNVEPRCTYVPSFGKCRLHEVYNSLIAEELILPDETLDVNELFEHFCNVLKEIVAKHTPLKKIGVSRFPCWFSTDLINLTIQKKRLHRKYKDSLDDQSYAEFSRIRTQCRTLSRVCYNDYIVYVEGCITYDPKAFWNFARNNKRLDMCPSTLKYGDQLETEPKKMCDLFASYFSSVFSPPSIDSSSYRFNTPLCFNELSFTTSEVFDALGELDITKGCGPDLIPSSVLRYCRGLLCNPLQVLFNKSLHDGIFPDVLKLGYVVPIHKGGSKEDATNYRPIIIQSAVVKMFEGLIVKKLNPLILNVISPKQHGFCRGRSTTTNLIVLETAIVEAFSSRKQLDAIYLDFSKAFDKVSHSHLLAKLEAYGFVGDLLEWMGSYLSNRRLVVKSFGSFSSEFVATSGVPQGSHLGPLLFNIFINDIVDIIKVDSLLFADDIKLYSSIDSEVDCVNLQRSLDAVKSWCRQNDMMLNVNKCSCITFHRTRSPICFSYKLDDAPLPRSNIVRDLGIVLSDDLTPHEHVNSICARAARVLGFITRFSRDFHDPTVLRTLYCTLVRPLLEYNCVMWSPHQVTLVRQIQSIQDKFIRLLGCRLGFAYRDVPLRLVEEQTGLCSLETRRSIQGVMFLHKLITGGISCPEILRGVFFRCPVGTRSLDLFGRRHVGSNYEANSTLLRIQRLGNIVSPHVDFFADSATVVKRKIVNALVLWNL